MDGTAPKQGITKGNDKPTASKEAAGTGNHGAGVITYTIAGAALGFLLGFLEGKLVPGIIGAGIGAILLYAFSASMDKSGNFHDLTLHVINHLYTAILMVIWTLTAGYMASFTRMGVVQGVMFGLRGGAMLGTLSGVYTFTLKDKFGYIIVGSGIGGGVGAGVGAIIGAITKQLGFFTSAGLFIGVFVFPFLFVLEDNSRRQKVKRGILMIAIATGSILGVVPFAIFRVFPFDNFFISYYAIVLVTVGGNFFLFLADFLRKEFPYSYGSW